MEGIFKYYIYIYIKYIITQHQKNSLGKKIIKNI
jgi:hypothetical protein